MEHKKEKLASKTTFLIRLVWSFLSTLILLSISLAIGSVGYHYLNNLNWVDSFFNASMILTGMGPADPMKNDMAKIFSSFYALFSGIIFLTLVAIMITPIYHRFLHKFHMEID